MCEVCQHNTISVNALELNAYDPTRTLTLRNAWARDMRNRFIALKRVIKKAVNENDCFGLKGIITQQLTPPPPGAFDFVRSQDKIEAFLRWLRQQEGKGLLELRTMTRLGSAIEQPWSNLYVYDSYKRGVQRAAYELHKHGYPIPSIEERGGLNAIMSSPFHIDRVGMLYSRVYEDLKGITSAMDTQISRVLSQGMIDGDNPRVLARKLVATIDGVNGQTLGITDSLGRYIPAQRRADMLARTEVIRAHHQANIQEYKNWGVEGVEVQAEFVTAGDDRVCSQCAGYHGNRYSLEEAEHMIPVHPLCRCIVIPITRRNT